VPDLIGDNIERYHVIEKLGEGGMATVFRAWDTRLERDVALKVIRREEFGEAHLARLLKRFEREAKALARLTHPNIVGVIDYGEYQGSPYLVMPFIPGGTLKDKTGIPMPYPEAARLLAPVADALSYAHGEGVIHRDVKPSNILLTASGKPMLTDFGIARILDSGEQGRLTGTGVGIGTPEYMSPEQGQGLRADERSDIYALGIVFYELVTGRCPYEANTPVAVVVKHITDPLPRPREYVPGLPEIVEKVLYKALAKKPEERYANMGEFVFALEKLGLDAEEEWQSVEKGQLRQVKLVQKPRPSTPLTHDDLQVESLEPVAIPTQTRHLARLKEIKKTLLLAVSSVLLLALIALGVVFVSGLVQDGKEHSTGSVAFLATPTYTSAFSPCFTHLPQVTFTPTSTYTPTRAITPASTYTPEVTSTPSPSIGSTRVSDIDGMVMIYVSAGEFTMGSSDADIAFILLEHPSWNQSIFTDEQPQHQIYLDSYWIDRIEVTNGMYAKCVSANICSPHLKTGSYTRDAYYGYSEYADFPVINVSRNDAEVYCQWAGRRLPSEAEWEKAARGTDGRIYPWGNQTPSCSLANYWSGISACVGDTVKVGSYPRGASPYGALDMVGNVREWVNDWYAADFYALSQSSNPRGPTSGVSHVLRGGEWSDEDIHTALRITGYDGLDSFTGFRCAYSDLVVNIDPSSTSASSMTTQSASRPTQGIGSTQVSPIDSMVQIYVPAGDFIMGSADYNTIADSDEKPEHTIFLDSYWIDRTEVTNGMFAMCVQAGNCSAPHQTNSFVRISYYGNPTYANYPVMKVTWTQAQGYCQWTGRRLPSEAEWEKAARGTDGRIYPWGNEYPDCNRANFLGCVGDSVEVGSYPNGASPYGALDMAGNVTEWVNDWYDADYYLISPSTNPTGPIDVSSADQVFHVDTWFEGVVFRGGSSSDGSWYLRVTNRDAGIPYIWNVNVGGFRCAMSATR
jgi:eukaryotic-like serine/threonine-protein kinase